MALFETWLKSDLKKPIRVEQLAGNLFSSDNGGNLVGVEVLDGGSPATLTGGVTGYIIRADGATVTVTGTLDGNRAYIVLPASAYVVVGQVSIVVKNGTTTVGACTAYVYRTTTDALVDPGHVIPSIEELLAKIADCQAATAAAMKVAQMTVSAETATGSTPTAVLTEEGSGALAHKHLTFGLIPGEDGVSPTVTVETITGGHKVTITDGSGDHDFNVMDGTDGQDGDDGVSAYCYVRWAANQPTQDSDMTTTPSDWMGIYAGTASSAPSHYTDYQWYKVKGETGTAQNVYGSTVPMSPSDSTKVETAINGKITKPATAGTSGQVLTSDGQGGQSWQTPSGGTVTDVQEDGTSILSSGVANILTMTGAGASAAGAKGLVPAPAAGDEGKFLRGDGVWQNVPNPQVMTGATTSTAGTSGLVPAPAAGAQSKVLTGGGTWEVSPGAKVYVKSVTVTNTSGSYSQTVSDEMITAEMKAVEIEIADPSIFGDTITVTSDDGEFTIECDDVAGSTTVKISFLKVLDDPTAVTSTEFDILSNRIGTLSDLTTTAKTDIVAAANELNAKHSRVLLKGIAEPSASDSYTLNDSVLNYDYIQILAKKNGKGCFMSTIIHKDDLSVGQSDVISLTAYNTSSYNAYIECGFPTNTTFKMPTFRATGWTIKPVYVVGIGKAN